MSSETKLHVAICPSLRVIEAAGGGNMLIRDIQANFTRNIYARTLNPRSKYVCSLFDKLVEAAMISWSVERDKDGKPVTVSELLKDLSKDGIPDITLNRITFLVQYKTYDHYTMQNVVRLQPWTFRPLTFRPLVWRRLKAENFPCKAIYKKWLELKRQYKVELGSDIYKRWKDTILFNEPNPLMDNDDIKSIWLGRKFALILKEHRGQFELMDLGELKP
jgi:hypothetical protein